MSDFHAKTPDLLRHFLVVNFDLGHEVYPLTEYLCGNYPINRYTELLKANQYIGKAMIELRRIEWASYHKQTFMENFNPIFQTPARQYLEVDMVTNSEVVQGQTLNFFVAYSKLSDQLLMTLVRQLTRVEIEYNGMVFKSHNEVDRPFRFTRVSIATAMLPVYRGTLIGYCRDADTWLVVPENPKMWPEPYLTVSDEMIKENEDRVWRAKKPIKWHADGIFYQLR